MAKEKSINPAQAQRKADKAKAIKKGKSEVLARRSEKLARRNPDRLQKQLDDLKAIESSGGKLTSHEKSVLEGLERDVKAVRKAREALGDKAPKFGSGTFDRREGRDGQGVLGKRRRGGDSEPGSSDEDVPEDVKSIPMPRDTPPPIPKEVLDKWYQKRRDRMGQTGRGSNANAMPLGDNARNIPERSVAASTLPPVEAKTVYEAKPVVRDLRKEAVAFVPAAVRAKLDKSKGVGGLVEPDEADRLEKEGYMPTAGSGARSGSVEEGRQHEGSLVRPTSRVVTMEEVEDEEG
ncbi:Uncharacterized protein BP5553_04470 [Venustampulla echinocandica]|uniref:Wbp11/ELF5/Saf1 N-terminal domain-containing protein n=1 Tax=Venustampulla echinocandica TaxID=2656787 RepID=A0A370TND7_9HELO|nr:Uncharacterized protein BP5553_04470 [Venustampulla echinocandica]RDL37037.1 Uncharacterized protein BP5553_04470 [Venustampulla echinocandica]